MMEHQLSSEERKNRFAYSGAETPRSASQPPTSSSTNGDGFYSTPAMQIYGSPGTPNGNGTGALGAGRVSPWGMSAGRGPPLARSASSSIGIPSSLPRSSSFSERAGYGGGGGSFASAIRESHSFPSTFEDDESEAMSDATGEYAYPDTGPAAQLRGRHFLAGDTRSRSQSLATATARPLPIGSPPASAGWGTGPLSIPGRFGDFKAPGSGSGLGSRYGSLGALARSPVGASPSPTGLRVSTGAASQAELTNISPLTRDVGQIMVDEDAWAAGMAAGNGNGGESGTTSRRHSVSVVQPRRGIVGFNAPEDMSGSSRQYFVERNGGMGGEIGNGTGTATATATGLGGSGGGGGLTISDDELASGLNMLNLNSNAPRTRSSLPPSQPSSLPIYAPLSRPLAESLSISTTSGLGAGAGDPFTTRRMMRSPSESAYSVSSSGGSPPRNVEHSPALESAYIARQHQQQYQPGQGQGQGQGRYVPSHGIQYIPEDAPAPPSPTYLRSVPGPNQSFMQMQMGQQQGNINMPLSPTGAGRGGQQMQMQMQQLFNQQQQQHQMGGIQGLQRRASQSEAFGPPTPIHQAPPSSQVHQLQQHQVQQQQSPLADLGRGIPLHAVPSTWNLYIVEFKAGRTDLFYVADPGSIVGGPVRVGDLVIVEADRGKDLGKVVNDTITAAEVEAFQRQQVAAVQAAAAAYGLTIPPVAVASPVPPTSPESVSSGAGGMPSPGAGPMGGHAGKKEINPKKIYAKATAQDAQLLVTKHADETKALALCQAKVKAKKLPMEVIDAEYQWDRRKLTFYFIADKRIDFRELVRELFRLYKTRIWMASLQGPASPE